jgi:hypothetical protein
MISDILIIIRGPSKIQNSNSFDAPWFCGIAFGTEICGNRLFEFRLDVRILKYAS